MGPGCVIGEGASVLNGSRIWPGVQIRRADVVNGIVVAPVEKSFYFYAASGQYTGMMASTVDGFLRGLEEVPIQSIEFHTKRRDFERWARSTLGSDDLADNIENIHRIAVTGEELRSSLIRVTKKWADDILGYKTDAKQESR